MSFSHLDSHGLDCIHKRVVLHDSQLSSSKSKESKDLPAMLTVVVIKCCLGFTQEPPEKKNVPFGSPVMVD